MTANWLCAGHSLSDALAGDGVDAGIGRGGDDVVAPLAQDGTAFMVYPPLSMTAHPQMGSNARRNIAEHERCNAGARYSLPPVI
jgi:hypothetical protein